MVNFFHVVVLESYKWSVWAWRSSLMLSPHIDLHLPSGLYPSGFSMKNSLHLFYFPYGSFHVKWPSRIFFKFGSSHVSPQTVKNLNFKIFMNCTFQVTVNWKQQKSSFFGSCAVKKIITTVRIRLEGWDECQIVANIVGFHMICNMPIFKKF